MVIHIDIHNSTKILEHIRQVLKSESFTGWTILNNTEYPNHYWETYPNYTARFFRFDLEKRTFAWQYEDDQIAMVDEAWHINNSFEADELFQFIGDNIALFTPSDTDKLTWAFDDFFSDPVKDWKDCMAASEPIAYKKRPKPLKFPLLPQTPIDYVSVQSMMSDIDPGLVFLMDYVYGLAESSGATVPDGMAKLYFDLPYSPKDK